MKRLLIITVMLVSVQISQAGHHEDGKNLAKRQPDASMTVTSVDLGQEKTTITATGAMSEYGKVYVTYNLAYNSVRSGGVVTGQGRGATADGIAAAVFSGHWYRDGSKVIMRNVVQIDDGTQNLDVITFDAVKNTLDVEVYVLK